MSRPIKIAALGLLVLIFAAPTWAAESTLQLPSTPPAKSGGFEAYRLSRQAPGLPSNPPGDNEKAPIFGGANFDAYDFDQNAIENVGNLFIPPDPMGAAGRDRLISVVNAGIECRDKAGALIFRDAMRDFFAPAVGTLGTLTFDPKIVYDPHADRFVVIALEQWDAGAGNPSDESRILVAVSRTPLPASPTAADWHYQVINASTVIGAGACWADYPGLEVDEEAVYITANMFPYSTSAGSFGVRLWIVDKGLGGGLYAGGPVAFTQHDPYGATGIPAFATTTMPAQVFGVGGMGPGLGTYLVSYDGLTFSGPGAPEAINVIRVNNPLAAVTFTQEFVTISDIEDLGGVFGFPALAGAPQAGGAALISVGDRRMLDAVWRNGFLWLCTTITPNLAFDPANAGQTTAHWVQLDATAVVSGASPAGLIALRQEGNAGGEDIDLGMFTFFPAIQVNGLNQMKLGFAGSSANTFGSAYVAGRVPADPVGTVGPTGIVRAGVDYYLRTFGAGNNRWGDYSGIAVDPADDTTFWLFNEWADVRGTPLGGEDGRWSTAWLQCSFAPIGQPDLVVTVLDGPCCTYHGDLIGPSVVCRVDNIGAAAAGPFSVGLYVSPDANITVADDLLVNGQQNVAGLASGGTILVAFPTAKISAAAPLGDVFLGAIADDTALVAETDETNNTNAYPIVVNTTVEGCTRAMASYRAAPTRVSLFNVPDGSGDALSAAQLFGGAVTVDATIDFMAQDCDGNPVPGIRPVLATTLGGLVVCPGDSKADAPTNAAGVATFSGPLYAGGYTDPGAGELTRVFSTGAPFAEILYGNKDMFASDQQGNIARVNLVTGTAGFVCNLGGQFSTEIEYNPLDGRSYAQATNGNFFGRLFDMFSCAALAPDMPTTSGHNGLEWVGTRLYSTNIPGSCGNSTFSILNPDTGVQIDVGPTGWGPISGLAWDACCHVMYGVTGCTQAFGLSNLLRIDLATGAATLIGNTQIQIGSIEFGPDHRLYAGGGQADGGNLWILDTNSGAANFVGPTGLIGVTGLALVSDPGLNIQFNSPDINGDLAVNLIDLGTFAADFNGAYAYRSDYKWDGTLNLADVGQFAAALGAICPAVIPAKPSNLASAGEVGLYFDAAASARTLDAEPQQPITAYVVARGEAARSGVSAWEYRLETSGNVKIDEWTLDDDAVLVGEGNDVIVGLGRTKAATDDGLLFLGQVQFHVTDTEPARIELKASSKPSVDDDLPVVLIGESMATLEVATLANGAAAAINDDSIEPMDTPVFAGVKLRNIPNPFNPATEIQFNLPRSGQAEVRIYDVGGREVRRLGGERLEAGAHAYRWNGTDNNLHPVVSGVYFYRLFLDGDDLGSPEKMTLLK